MAKTKRSRRNQQQTKASQTHEDAIVRELDALKRLIMLQLVASGVKPIDIATTLDIAKSSVSDIVPVRKLTIGRKRSEQAQ